jgi:Flp pilus assembly protein TadG
MEVKNLITRAASAARSRVRSVRFFVTGRGQAAVEFALVATVAMIVLFVAVQLALIGEDALALGQMNYQGARWAAVNTCATYSDIANYILSVGSPSVTESGGTCGTQLTVTITDSYGVTPPATNTSGAIKGSSSACGSVVTPTACVTGTTTRSFGAAVTITLTFDASKAIFLGNGSSKWMGLISFPTQLTSTETAMSE